MQKQGIVFKINHICIDTLLNMGQYVFFLIFMNVLK